MTFPLLITRIDDEDPQTLRLERSALPEEFFPERSSLRHVKRYYPGSSEPHTQVLSVERKPITIRGLLSDKETRVEGFADQVRGALQRMHDEAHVVALAYRKTYFEGLIVAIDFDEIDQWEIRYELEFDPIYHDSPHSLEPVDLASNLNARALQLRAEELERALDAYDEVRPPSDEERRRLEELASTFTVEVPQIIEDYPPERVELVLDPHLEFQLQARRAHRQARRLLELAGNETLLNLDDQAQVVARSAWIAANLARSVIASIEDGDSIQDQLGHVEFVWAILSSLNSLRLILR